MQRWAVICWALLALVGAEECPDGGRCEAGETCCHDPRNGYECCPFEQAECCGDHDHCCPAHTICNAATSSCVNATVSIPWVERTCADQPRLKSFRMIKAYMGEDDDNICPDQSRCPAEFSCLKALTRFGCCPLAQGVSCSDGKHCCPEGHQCSVDSRSCIKKEAVTTVLCKDGVSECPDGSTCCENPEGKWGCCPLPRAVCCSDKAHCCPEATTCDLAHSKCISLSTKKEMPMWAKLPARIRAEWENQKEGDHVTAQTVHEAGTEKIPQVPTANTVSSSVESSVTKAAGANGVLCNATTACPNGNTCTKTKDGSWACCPLPQAVCCDDHEHCCPTGTTCDLDTFTCQGTSGSAPTNEKIPAFSTAAPTTVSTTTQVSSTTQEEKTMVPEVQEVMEETEGRISCGPHTSASCPEHTTCCFMEASKRWGCCPLPEAVCCADGNHCCPTNYKCNEGATSCIKGEVVIPWYTKIPATISVQDDPVSVKCSSVDQCPTDTTCCQLLSGKWGCCPLKNAVCCQDMEHCCPQGFACNIVSKSCQKVIMLQLETIPLTPVYLSESQAQVSPGKYEDVQCDNETRCKDGETCCRTSATTWGCCPLPNAVCCSDMQHCCPAGYTCSGESCTKNTGLGWVAPQTQLIPLNQKDVPCDDKTSCKDGETCCRTSATTWGCCPLPNAVCCSDMQHCCPAGYTCSGASCTKNTGLGWVAPQTQLIPLNQKDVPCDDKTSCKDGETCCRTSATTWGCCPLPNAVCCSDMQHCCPAGYTCSGASCTKNTGLGWVAPQTQLTPLNQKDVPCDDKTSCKDGQTCCRTSATTWGCCPTPNAVCCSDMKHCCPTGYTCSGASCTKNTGLPWDWWYRSPDNKKRALIL
ncbi:granulin a isoform X2 [Mugil cephalus]|uniref:granulin a isoform X2 n=1 Tax=Mugil cephalus TaxID=48193 RepID=UPI001FB61A60|nr:granulin a isoform X2 [Mugil cephalus]